MSTMVEGLQQTLNDYRAQTNKEPTLIRVGPNVEPDHCYVGEFGGREP